MLPSHDIETLKNFLVRDYVKIKSRNLSNSEYDTRMMIVMNKLSKVCDILVNNHWSIVESYMSTITVRTTPGKFLKKSFIIGINKSRRHMLVYNYLIDLYVLLHQFQMLNDRDECSIKYEEFDYE